MPAIRTSKAANFDGAYAPSGSLPLYFFIALLLLLCFLADVVRVPSVGTHIGELVSSDTQNSYGVPSVISKAY